MTSGNRVKTSILRVCTERPESGQVEEAVGNLDGDPHAGLVPDDEAERDESPPVEYQQVAGRVGLDARPPFRALAAGGVSDLWPDELVDPQCIGVIERGGEQLRAPTRSASSIPESPSKVTMNLPWWGEERSTFIVRAVVRAQRRAWRHPLVTIGGQRDDHIATEPVGLHHMAHQE